MRIITTAIIMFSSVLSFAQTGMESGNSAELKRVSDRANRASEEVRTLRNEVSALRAKNNDLQSQLSGMQEKVSAEITRSQELQAQNERAMNLALDEFKKKFEEQNKTVEGVQASLDDKFNKQLIHRHGYDKISHTKRFESGQCQLERISRAHTKKISIFIKNNLYEQQ